MNKFDEMREAITDAEETLRAANSVAARMANLLIGRLRNASTSTLRKLKRELRDFDSTTGAWKR